MQPKTSAIIIFTIQKNIATCFSHLEHLLPAAKSGTKVVEASLLTCVLAISKVRGKGGNLIGWQDSVTIRTGTESAEVR